MRGVPVARVVSGGQTGVDRAALDVAIELGLPHGGWVPRGRAAEDGPLHARYQVQETPGADPAERTGWNVRDSDATLLVSRGPLAGGTELTRQMAVRYGGPFLSIDLATLSIPEAADRVARWLGAVRPSTLNVAGPRASEDAEIYQLSRMVLSEVLRPTRGGTAVPGPGG